MLQKTDRSVPNKKKKTVLMVKLTPMTGYPASHGILLSRSGGVVVRMNELYYTICILYVIPHRCCNADI